LKFTDLKLGNPAYFATKFMVNRPIMVVIMLRNYAQISEIIGAQRAQNAGQGNLTDT
jgi:hypothetical protein